MQRRDGGNEMAGRRVRTDRGSMKGAGFLVKR